MDNNVEKTNNSAKKKKIIIIISIIVAILLLILFLFLIFGNTPKVTFDTLGGNKVNALKVGSNGKIIKPKDPVKKGYRFLGWYYNGKPFDFNTKITKNIVLEARWEKIGDAKVTGVKLNLSELTLAPNKEANLIATIMPSDAKNKNLTWKSSNESIVSVDKNGHLKALKEGNVIITVVTKDGNYEATCKVTVTKEVVSVSSVTINGNSTVNVGQTITLEAKIDPDDASNKGVKWSSSNSKIATVNASGVVTGLKEGTVTITVKTDDGGKTASKKITVKQTNTTSSAPVPSSPSTPSTPSTPQYYPVTAISVSGPTEVVEGQAIKLNVSISPANATNKGVVWRVNNGNATIDQSGNLTGVHAGSVVVTVTSTDNNQTATWNVTVKEKPGSYSITLTAISTTIGEKQYSISVTRNGQAFNDYNWIQFGSYGAPFPAGQYVSAGIVENNIKGVSTATITITNTKYINIDGANIKATVNIR